MFTKSDNELKRIGKKIAALDKLSGSRAKETVYTAVRDAILDNKCSKALLKLNVEDLEKIKNEPEIINHPIQKKLDKLIKYVTFIERIIDHNVKEVTGLNGDDMALLQRVMANKKIKKAAVLEKLILIVDDFRDAESQDKDILVVSEAMDESAKPPKKRI